MEAIWALYLVTTTTAKIDLIIFQTFFFPEVVNTALELAQTSCCSLNKATLAKKEREKADRAAVIYCCCD